MGSNETRCSSASCGSNAPAHGALKSSSRYRRHSVPSELSPLHAASSSYAAVASNQNLVRCRDVASYVSTPMLLICCRAGCWLALGNLDQLHIQAQRLQLADQHVERLRHAGLHGSFALDDGLVNLGSAIDIVGLRRQQLLQNERRPVC